LANQNFYRDIKALTLPIAEVFQSQHFFDIPEDWFIIVADIQNSTATVTSGRHNDVNLVAAGSLIAALNSQMYLYFGSEPCLLQPYCRTIDQMQWANALGTFRQRAQVPK
jgi:hypothetical protein